MRTSARRARSKASPKSAPSHGARRGSKTATEGRYAEAFAVILAREDKAMLYGPGNDQTHGWRSIFEATRFAEIIPGRAFFVNVAADVLAGDWDAKGSLEQVSTLHEELKAAGVRSVLVESGQPGHYQIFARIADRALRERFALRAKELGFDVRDAIRPPMSPHRLWGTSEGRQLGLATEWSRPLDPTDPFEALVALASTTDPPPRLRGRMRQIAFDGNPDDRSLGAAATTLALVNRGHSLDSVERFLLDPKHKSGAKLQAIKDPDLRRTRIEQLYRTARKKYADDPPRREHTEVDGVLDRIIAQLSPDSQRWRGKTGSPLYVLFRILLMIARCCGSLTLTPGCRRLAELFGSDRRTVGRLLKALEALGLVELVRRGGGFWPHTLRIVDPMQADHVSSYSRFGMNSADHDHDRDLDSGAVGPISPGGQWEKWRGDAACLRDPVAPDTFGPNGWFETSGLGFEAWHALVLIEEGVRPVPRSVLLARLGPDAAKVLRDLIKVGLVACNNDRCVRGPATLVEVARSLRTLGTRTLKQAQHNAERVAYRRSLPWMAVTTDGDDDGESRNTATLRARVLALAEPLGWPPALCAGGEAEWRRTVAAASEESLRAKLNALEWWSRKRRASTASRTRSG